jgi:CO/xanthine dehydrogenase FAD-binding subunit
MTEAELSLIGHQPSDSLLTSAAGLVGPAIDPPTDSQASSDYRRSIARVLVVRALKVALERAENRMAT